MMDFWKSISGMMELELTSADVALALGVMNGKNITLYDVKQISDLVVRFRIRRRDYSLLADLAEKRGETLRVVRRRGIYWSGQRVVKRPVFLVGVIFLLALALYLPTRVFFVRVEGNVSVPDRLILAAAEECGICFGASRREVRSEKVKNALLAAVPQLQWAGVNTSGCLATVSVRERSVEETESEGNSVSSIAAIRDGYILSATATRGTLLCKVGDAVQAGQVLISGYTDCGISIQATRAEGEIFAQTNRSFAAVTPTECLIRGDILDTKRKISLCVGKKRINLWKDSGIWDATCGRMYEEYYITLPGGFQLPVALCLETYTFYETGIAGIQKESAEDALTNFSETYLKEQMVAGSILRKSQTITDEDGYYRMEGTFVCAEMIGRVQQEQIGETNGKSS